MKKICFFSGDITRSGGTERVSSMVANGLMEQGNYDILFLSLVEQQKKTFFYLNERIKHYSLGKKWINPGIEYVKIIPKLRSFFKNQEIDIIIDIDIVLDILSIPAAKGLKTKIISWEHFNYYYEKKSFYRYCILKYSVKRTDYIITLTLRDKELYQKNFNRNQRIEAIYNPMQRQKDQDMKKEKWLITVGHLIKRKGMDYLSQVACVILKKYPDWKWLVIGDGEERELLQKVIKKNHLQNQLILIGRRKDVTVYLKKAQIYVMTSRIEGLPMCLLEAKAFCIPSVSFDIPTGPAEIIEDGVNGYLIKDFNCKEMVKKLEILIEDETVREQFSKNTKKDLSKFQIETILEKWNKVLEAL